MVQTLLQKFRGAGKQRTLLVLVGGLLLVLVLGYRVAPMMTKIGVPEAELRLKEKRLAKYRGLIREGNALEERLKMLQRRVQASEAGLLQGKTASLAAVDIQNAITEIAAASDVEIKTVRILKPEKSESGMYLRIPVQFSVQCGIRELKDILYRIEASPKHLTVQQVRITVARRGRTEQIRSDITIFGLMKKVGE
jgi:hypothetical protein